MTGVYALNCNKSRRKVWWEIGAARGLFSGPWVVGGDFKIVRFVSDMTEFFDCVEDMEMTDPKLEGGSYTWSRWKRLPELLDFLLHIMEQDV